MKFQTVSKFRTKATRVIGTDSYLCFCNLEIQFVFIVVTQRSILLISSQFIHLIPLEHTRNQRSSDVSRCWGIKWEHWPEVG